MDIWTEWTREAAADFIDQMMNSPQYDEFTIKEKPGETVLTFSLRRGGAGMLVFKIVEPSQAQIGPFGNR